MLDMYDPCRRTGGDGDGDGEKGKMRKKRREIKVIRKMSMKAKKRMNI